MIQSWEQPMTLGLAERQGDLLDDVVRFCDETLPEGSIYALLHRERDRLFPDEMFEDLFSARGRRSVPPSVVATVMVLQRLEGLSDREAVERYTFDARWRYAAGVGGYDSGGWARFAHTVLVDMRARLDVSEDPKRIFRVSKQAAAAAGLVGARRVLDSTPLYDAVATQDTVTLIRSAIRQLLAAADRELVAELRGVLVRDDDYCSAGKPVCDWDDPVAREALVAELAADGYACLGVLEGRDLAAEVTEAAELLATVLGQDLEDSDDGRFRIARRVAKDRVISTVDPDARHGHKTAARGFDGYKGHVAIDPDSEIITDTTVTAGNAGDASVAEDLIGDLLDNGDRGEDAKVYGDAAYGTGELQQRLNDERIDSGCRTQPASAPAGRYGKDQFSIDLDDDTVTCPAGVTVQIRRGRDGGGTACFAEHCTPCPQRSVCTNADGGRTIRVGKHEAALARARQRQADPDWRADYRATRPKVERKLGHLMRRRHGGRRARVRGQPKVDADFNLLAAAANLARLAALGLRATATGWATTA